jgi:adenylate cyclase
MGRWADDWKRHWSELRRRRVVRTAIAYLVAGWVLLQVADVTFAPLGLPAWSQRALIIAVAAGLVPACILAWIFDLTPRGVVRTEAPAAAPAAQDGDARAAFSPIASVAILPFADLSPQHDQDWFCDGLAEEIIDSLCCVRGLRVASRTASFRFRDGGVDPREIGRQLAVGAILEGSVRKAGADLRVTAQLIDADTGFHLWSEKFDRRLEDVFAIQTEIARRVAEALRLSLAGPALGRSQRYAPGNLAAYEYYLRGRQLAAELSDTGLMHAPKLFERAIELDPGYAQAYAGLADILAQLLLWRLVDAETALPRAAAAASRALDLAPDLAEAHVAQGHIRSLAGDAAGAIRAFERAVELNPGLFDAWNHYARHLMAQGEYAHAADLFQRAWRTRPDDCVPLALAVSALDAAGDAAGSEALARRALAGLRKQAELEPDNARVRYMAAGVALRVGDVAGGRDDIETALRLRPDEFATLYNAACFHSLLGEGERALALLERAISAGTGYPDWIDNDPDLANIRALPQFRELLARMRAHKASPAAAG